MVPRSADACLVDQLSLEDTKSRMKRLEFLGDSCAWGEVAKHLVFFHYPKMMKAVDPTQIEVGQPKSIEPNWSVDGAGTVYSFQFEATEKFLPTVIGNALGSL